MELLFIEHEFAVEVAALSDDPIIDDPADDKPDDDPIIDDPASDEAAKAAFAADAARKADDKSNKSDNTVPTGKKFDPRVRNPNGDNIVPIGKKSGPRGRVSETPPHKMPGA